MAAGRRRANAVRDSDLMAGSQRRDRAPGRGHVPPLRARRRPQAACGHPGHHWRWDQGRTG